MQLHVVHSQLIESTIGGWISAQFNLPFKISFMVLLLRIFSHICMYVGTTAVSLADDLYGKAFRHSIYMHFNVAFLNGICMCCTVKLVYCHIQGTIHIT